MGHPTSRGRCGLGLSHEHSVKGEDRLNILWSIDAAHAQAAQRQNPPAVQGTLG